MARTVEQIERDIVALEQAIATFAQEFDSFYRQYLDELGQSVRRQLVLATYHICTQNYPEQFLALSVSQRENLQRSLRQLAKTAPDRLLGYLELPDPPAPDPTTTVPPDGSSQPQTPSEAAAVELDSSDLDPEQIVASIDLASFSLAELGSLENRSEDPDLDGSNADLGEANLSDPDLRRPDLRRWFSSSTSTVASSGRAAPSHPSGLGKLARWQAHIENGISETLRELSQAANHLLYQATILPNQLPEPLLEVATKSGMAAESSSGQPNILKLMIEAKSEHEVSVAQVTVIRLRLLDIEEADYGLRAWPSKLRGLNQRLNQLGREYQRKCKERAIAQSEQAWRAIWFED